MKNALIITLSFLLLVSGVIAWLFYKGKIGRSAGAGSGSGDPLTDPGKPSSTELSKNEQLMPLKRGSGYGNKQKEQLVTDLQIGLNTNWKANISVDGDFGGQTFNALQSRGLPTVIYWKQWSYITKKPIYVGGQQITVISL